MGNRSNRIGIFWGAFVFIILLFGISGYYFRTGLHPIIMVLVAMTLGALSYFAGYKMTLVVKKIIDNRPSELLANILAVVGSTYLLSSNLLRLPTSILIWIVLIGASSFALIGIGIHQFAGRSDKKLNGSKFIALGLVGCIGLFIWFWKNDEQKKQVWTKSKIPVTSSTLNDAQSLNNLLEPGAFEFDYFTYGSQKNKRRDIFSDNVRYETATVDATIILPEWKGKKKKWREKFWGFGVDEFPINGHVWMPITEQQTDKPFPLILIVHGNHSMEHYSDPGYSYLGEFLASRGFAVVSIDENYINGTWSGDFRGKEMPTRAWLVLKHLEQWRKWNESDNALKGKVDMSNIVLVGHSRGGEAVAIAKAYNELAFFPDDARERFNFNFGIKGLVSIAPTDKRYFRRMALNDVHYLTLQGSYDSDESSFFGRRIGDRISYNDSIRYINTGVMIHGANHGQFNSIWGSMDMGPPTGWLLNTKALISATEQRAMARFYIGSFAEMVLHGNENLESIFKYDAVAKAILKNDEVLQYFAVNGSEMIADFEEDIDITTSNVGQISGQNLALWKEDVLRYRDADWQENKAVVIGWIHTDSMNPSIYEIDISQSGGIDANSNLRLDISLGDLKWLPKKIKEQNKGKSKDVEEDDMTIDFSIELVDTSDQTYRIQLSEFKSLAPRLKIQFYRHSWLNKNLGKDWEPTLESCHIPLTHFGISAMQKVQIKQARFIFDQCDKGVVILDNIGFSPN